MPDEYTINITGIDPNTNQLIVDRPDQEVNQGDIVNWAIGTSQVSAITGIYDNIVNDVFSPDPAPVNGTSAWQGTISNTATGAESYTIQYNISGQGTRVFSHDPIIQVKPKK